MKEKLKALFYIILAIVAFALILAAVEQMGGPRCMDVWCLNR